MLAFSTILPANFKVRLNHYTS